MKPWSTLFLAIVLISCTEIDRTHTDDSDPPIPAGTYEELNCYFFFIADCPAVRNNLPKINDLVKTFAPFGLSVTGIVSDPDLDQAKLDETISEFDVQFPVVLDTGLTMAKAYGASVTPQVFLYNSAGALVYSGAVDNYFYSLGKHRKIVSEPYLNSAISRTLAGVPVRFERTEPIGCKINYDFFNDPIAKD